MIAAALAALIAGCGGGGAAGGPGGGVNSRNVVDVTANAGPIVAVRVGDTAVLDGSRSKTSSAFVAVSSYQWAFTSKPAGSTATLQDAATATPSFLADVAGVYTVQLVAGASGVASQRQVGIVVATVAPARPTGPFNHMGLSSNCVNCHDGTLTPPLGGSLSTLNKPATHIASSNLCQACHTPQGFVILPFVDHDEIFGNCSGCHNGTTAIGKSPFHTPTDAECDSCHNTSHFLTLNPDGTFDHSTITSVCTACHGRVATGKPAGHIATDTECGYCHFTTAFIPAYPDHTGPDVVGKRCDTCHVGNGSGPALGYPLGHPTMAVDCVSCHNINTFNVSGAFDHSLVDPAAQPCEGCHTGNNATFFANLIQPGGKFTKADFPGHVTTSADCNACHSSNIVPLTFAGAYPDHTVPPQSTQPCDSCHNGTTATGMDARVPAHMPVGPTPAPGLPGAAVALDCGACHTPGTFATGWYDHVVVGSGGTLVASGCNGCHNDQISVGKYPNHMPTNPDTQDCGDCHTTTAFAPTAWGHQGIDLANCALCHNGTFAIDKTPGVHIPTPIGADCSDCHDPLNYTTFTGIAYNHFGIDPNNCAECHVTGIGGAATKAASPTPHIPAANECSLCHTSTAVGGFAINNFLGGEHLAITVGCEGCHKNTFFPTRPTHYKGATHLPTGQDCYVCHFNTGGFQPSIRPMPHTGINSGCASCHDGTAAFVAVGAVGPDMNFPIHNNLLADCAACHNTTTFVGGFVDHTGPLVSGRRCDSCHDGVTATGKDAKPNHVTTSADCNQCHTAGGAFAPARFDHTGIVSGCAACHDGTQATGPSISHPPYDPLTQDCSLCHNTTAFAGARYNHAGIVDNCARCHDGATARGKVPPPNHVPTDQDCHVCHQTTGFLPATFSHDGITGNCSSCHGAGFATPKPVLHVATTADCGTCHNTTTFVGAVYDHTGIVDGCATCHVANGSGVAIGQNIGQNPPHLTTALDCHFCHTPGTFRGGGWVHDASAAGNCDSCHVPGGGASTVKGPNHLSTTVQCDVCHNTTAFVPDIFSHSPSGNYPGDHRRALSCQSCHGSTVAMPFVWDYPQYAPYCAACHANNFRSVSSHIGGRSGTVEQNKNCGRSGCHRITSSGF